MHTDGPNLPGQALECIQTCALEEDLWDTGYKRGSPSMCGLELWKPHINHAADHF